MAKKQTKQEPIRGLRVVNADTPTLYLYDEIGPSWAGMIDDNAVLDALNEFGDVDEINVRINSPGGVVDKGSTIYNLLVDHSAKINVRIDGIAASIASVIAMAGDTITVSANSRFMIHNAMTIAWGNKHYMTETADMLDKADQGIIATYEARSGQSFDQISDWMDAETWFTADEAIEAGFADNKVAAVKNIAMRVPKDRYKNAPKDLVQYEYQLPAVALKTPPAREGDPPIEPTISGRSPISVAARLAQVKAGL